MSWTCFGLVKTVWSACVTWKISRHRTDHEAHYEIKPPDGCKNGKARTHEMTKPGAKLDLGLNEGVAVVLEREHQNLLHLVR